MIGVALDKELAITGVGRVGMFEMGYAGDFTVLSLPDLLFSDKETGSFYRWMLAGWVFPPVRK